MKVNSFYNSILAGRNVYRSGGKKHEALVKRLDQLNSSDSYTRIGDKITLNDGTTFNVNDIPKLNVELLSKPYSKNNVMDFGSMHYFKYTNSMGKNIAIFSNPGGELCRPLSESIHSVGYDRDTERYIGFWNSLSSGNAMMISPNYSPQWGYSDDQIRSYLEEAGISKGFFSVKVGSKSSELFYSSTEQYPLYSKAEYDFRYYTMTSSECSYHKSVFKCLEPGTEITIAGEKYALKDDFTLDIPYGRDIYDIHIPKHDHTNKVPAFIESRV